MMISLESWQQYNPVQIHLGRGCRVLLAEKLSDHRALIVCSPRGRRHLESDASLSQALRKTKSLVWMDTVETNPDLHRLQDMTKHLLDVQVDCVVAFGGGSAIDSAKFFALALSPIARRYSIQELLDLASDFPVGTSLPLYALPTTAGTGSEVTPFATVWNHSARQKLSLAGPAVYPHTAFVDPEFCDTVPYDSTLNTGLDAINQAAESIWNRNMTPISEMLAHRALKLGMVALPKLLNDLENQNLRNIMAEVSLLAGLAISQTRTSLCHSISYPMTAHFGVPHGLACAFTMPSVLRHNLAYDDGRLKRLEAALDASGSPNISLLRRFEDFIRFVGVHEEVKLQVPSLEVLTGLVDEMYTPGRADNNLGSVSSAVIEKILTQSWDV